ncbi:MAG: protein-L-isoaspartate(D-aspartate) O-methyltransferase [Alphaproteobacteria bacterium]|nr:protein-L-isoaspartate(D-aspartate) O-methyltransferase [Alphaproteobacteria bacterium]
MSDADGRARLILELRRCGVADLRVLNAMERVPREYFVPPAFVHQAWENVALPIDCGQTISQPAVVARMTEALQLDDRSRVLEIGTGSGYQTAVLSYLCRRVYTIERHRELLGQAESRLATLRRRNITARPGDGALGWPEQAPFERILVTAAAIDIPPNLSAQLAIGGIMVVPIGDNSASQSIVRVRRDEAGLDIEELGPVKFVPLISGQAGEAVSG